MNFSTSSSSIRARVDAVLASPVWRGGGGATGDSGERLLTAAQAIRRQLGIPAPLIVSHAVSIMEGAVSEACAECLDAVAQLGARADLIPNLAQLHEILFEMKDAAGAAEFFPTQSVLGPSGLEEVAASAALEKVLGVLAKNVSTGSYDPEPNGHGVAGYARTELQELLARVFNGRYFSPDPLLSKLGPAQSLQVGDILRIALFTAFVRASGVDRARLEDVREAAVGALLTS